MPTSIRRSTGKHRSLPFFRHNRVRRRTVARSQDGWAAAWSAAWTRQTDGLGQAHVAFFGDSVTEGFYGATPYYTQSYPGQVAAALATESGQTAGSGIVPVYEFDVVGDPRLAEVGTWSGSTAGGFFNKLRYTATGSLTFGPVTCSAFRITYLTTATGGPWTATVDAGTPEAFTSLGANAVQVVDVDAGGAGSHTLTLAASGNMWITAVEALDNTTTGVKVSRVAYSGQKATQLVLDGTAIQSLSCLETVQPDLAVLAFGLNDAYSGPSVAAFRTGMTTIIDTINATGGSVLIVIVPPPNPAWIPNWADYRQAMQQLAGERNTGLIDFEALWGTWAENPTLYHDDVHPSAAGMNAMAAVIADYVIDAARVLPPTPPSWTPADLATLALWLDASDAATLNVTGSTVNTWTDKQNAYVGTSAGGPQLVAAAQNGLDVVRFDGINDVFSFGDVLDLGTDSLTMFAVVRNQAGQGYVAGKWKSTPNDGSYCLVRADISGRQLSTYYDAGAAIAILNQPNVTNNTQVLGMMLDRVAGTVSQRVDGAAFGSTASFTPDSTTPRNNAQAFVLGALRNVGDTGWTANWWLNGDICEVVLCLSVLTGADLSNLETYLKDKWGII